MKLGLRSSLNKPNDKLTPALITKNLQLKLNQGLKLNTPTMKNNGGASNIKKMLTDQFVSPDRLNQSKSSKFKDSLENKNL